MKRLIALWILTTTMVVGACSYVTISDSHAQTSRGTPKRFGHVAPLVTFSVSAVGRDKRIPKLDPFTRHEIAQLHGALTPEAWRDLRIAFLESGSLVVFAGGPHRSSAASQSLLDCYDNPPCHHYCPVFVVFSMNDTSVLPSETGRCADSLAIWKKV